MPSLYAHHRFGVQLLPTLPADVRGAVSRHRDLFDAGLQGPDFFFYYRPSSKSKIGELGHDIHVVPGREYFTRVCQNLFSISGEDVLVYLYGLLAHYCLDSQCHPLIHAYTQSGIPSHNAAESEFDRYLMALDGIKRPHAHPRSRYMKLTKAQCNLIAPFYEPATPAEIWEAVSGMRHITDLLTCANPLHRTAAKGVLHAMGGSKIGLLIPPSPDLACTHLNKPLMERFEDALSLYPVLLEQLRDHLSLREELGAEFDAVFG